MSENRTFRAYTSGHTVTGYEYIQYSQNAVYLTNLDGWDNYAGMEIETVPALERPGSYILGMHASEREVTASFNFQNSSMNILNSLSSFQANCLAGSVYTLERVYTVDGEVKLRETLQGLVSSISWERKMDNATLTVNFKCVDPVKTVYVDGSTTPQAGGRI